MRSSIALSTLLAFSLLLGSAATGQQQQVDKEKLKKKAQEQSVDKEKLKGKARGQGDEQDLKERAETRGAEVEEDDGGNAGAIAGGIAAAAVVGTVIAKTKGGDGKKDTETTLSFGSMDGNQDGKLSRDEFTKAMSKGFASSDNDKDGKVTRDEALAAYGERGGTYFDALDDEKTGAVSMETLQNDAEEAFRWADANDDGFITADERSKATTESTAAEKEQKANPAKKAKKLMRAVT
jgi:Ca2+-binding EF-hand superfamily protein